MEPFNIKEYLDSGVIELYVLDQLDDAGREAVEKLAAQYPEIRTEIAEVEEAIGTYHTMDGLTPPAHILTNILASTATAPPKVSDMPSAPLTNRRIGAFWPMAAAVVGLALALWMFLGKQNAQKEVASLQKETENLSANAATLNNRLQLLSTELNELKAVCCAEKVVVKGNNQPIASVYWNKTNQLAYLKLENLTDPGSQKQYQLWAFVGGKPVSVGVVDWEALKKGLVAFNFKNKPEAFAISLEQFGGSAVPTDVKGASDPIQQG